MSQSWTWAQIKAALEDKGTPLAALARRHKKTNAAFSMVKLNSSSPCQQIIADALGVPPHEIWPHRYDSRGRPRTGAKLRSRKHNPRRRSESRLNNEAA